MLTRRQLAQTGLAAAATSLADPRGARAQAAAVKIALLMPLTGAWARYGELKKMGAAPTQMDQGQFGAQIAAQTKANKALLDKAGVKPE